MIEVDGAYGEGGGQLVRTAAALAAITGTGVRVTNIRAKRPKPGLAAQHLSALKAVAAVSGAEVEGLELGSGTVTITPGTAAGGKHRFDVGTAGSVTLILQAVLPPALLAPEPTELHLIGGTDVPWSPPLDYFRFVFLPLLERMGGHVEIEVSKRGYYPRGGGEVRVHVEPCPRLRPLFVEPPGNLRGIRGKVHAANLPEHVVTRMKHEAARPHIGPVDVTIESAVLGPEEAVGQGGAAVLWAERENTVLGAARVAEKGVPAERIGSSVGAELLADLRAGASLDVHAADQVLIYAGLAGGDSVFSAREISLHAETTMWLLRNFLDVRFETSQIGAKSRLQVVPRGNR